MAGYKFFNNLFISRNMRPLIVLPILLLISSSLVQIISAEEKPYDRAISYPGITDQYDVASLLVQNEIPFFVSPDGYIHFHSKYESEVEKIKKSLGDMPSISFDNVNFAKLFIALMVKNDIFIRIHRDEQCSDKILINWDLKNDSVVKNIIEKDFPVAIQEGVTVE